MPKLHYSNACQVRDFGTYFYFFNLFLASS
jgi:hypothetical protein